MTDLSPLDQRIVELIRSERATYRSCSARSIARQLRMNNVYISKRLAALKTLGIVDYHERVPGSIHLVGTVEVEESALRPITPDATGATAPGETVAPVVTPTPPKESRRR